MVILVDFSWCQMILRFFRNILFFFVCALLPASGNAAERLTVFAAASMTNALERIGAAYADETGTEVVFSFAGTGVLARQIEAGAPADVFVSADEDWMAHAVSAGAVQPDSVRTIAANRLVLVGPSGSEPLSLSAEAVKARLGGDRLVMADPETVPAGRYGKVALETAGIWDAVSGSLAPMDNVRIALASVARGDTPLGLVYASDAHVEPRVTVLAEIPADAHPPIVYPAALTREARDGAEAFVVFLRGPKAQSILTDSGFAGIAE